MKCLTAIESRTWLQSFGIDVLGDLDSGMHNLPLGIREKAAAPRQEVFCLVPQETGPAEAFAAQIVEWVPEGGEQLFLLTHWMTEPDRRASLFESVRQSWGENRSLAGAPGLSYSTESDRALICELVFLSLCYTWEGYIVSANCHDFIFLGDAFVKFSSADAARIDEAKSIMELFKLEPRAASPWDS